MLPPALAELYDGDLWIADACVYANFVNVTMNIGDLTLQSLATAPVLSGGDGVLYLTQWDYNDKVYWVGAEVRADDELIRRLLDALPFPAALFEATRDGLQQRVPPSARK